MSNITHFLIPFGMREKWPGLNCVSPVLMQNLDIWTFHSLQALNNGKLPGDPKKYSSLIKRETHNKRGFFKNEMYGLPMS